MCVALSRAVIARESESGRSGTPFGCDRGRTDRMPVLALTEAAPLLPARGALIGLDLGTKTIGVATSDPDRRLATAVETIARKTFSVDAARILALAAERSAAGFVLGL